MVQERVVVGDNEVRFDYKEKAYVLDYVKVRGIIDTIILLPLNKSSPLIYSFHRFLKEHFVMILRTTEACFKIHVRWVL